MSSLLVKLCAETKGLWCTLHTTWATNIQTSLQKNTKKMACLQGKLSVGSEEYKTKEEEKNMCLVFFKITFFDVLIWLKPCQGKEGGYGWVGGTYLEKNAQIVFLFSQLCERHGKSGGSNSLSNTV